MKCKHCDGTGTTNWCVNGTFVDCPYCGGTGEIKVEQTNEEWMHTLNTEQLADKLTDFSFWLVFAIPTEDKREKVKKDCGVVKTTTHYYKGVIQNDIWQ